MGCRRCPATGPRAGLSRCPASALPMRPGSRHRCRQLPPSSATRRGGGPGGRICSCRSPSGEGCSECDGPWSRRPGASRRPEAWRCGCRDTRTACYFTTTSDWIRSVHEPRLGRFGERASVTGGTRGGSAGRSRTNWKPGRARRWATLIRRGGSLTACPTSPPSRSRSTPEPPTSWPSSRISTGYPDWAGSIKTTEVLATGADGRARAGPVRHRRGRVQGHLRARLRVEW